MRTLLAILVLLIPIPAFAQATCPTTASSNHGQFVPPAPFQAVQERGTFWFGTPRLWVPLREDGLWGGLYRADLKVYRNKLPLYRSGFDSRRESEPSIVISARRVNQPPSGGAILAERAHGVSDGTSSFIMTALDLPVGCWRIEAQYANEPSLVFVVNVR